MKRKNKKCQMEKEEEINEEVSKYHKVDQVYGKFAKVQEEIQEVDENIVKTILNIDNKIFYIEKK